ncbi:hypothetical protein BDD12DRAFT_388190 [Trichophaea hybrida]|nr:hypothetical protein BDD12DRAFT_388190 [Trichophaea hybrida]
MDLTFYVTTFFFNLPTQFLFLFFLIVGGTTHFARGIFFSNCRNRALLTIASVDNGCLVGGTPKRQLSWLRLGRIPHCGCVVGSTAMCSPCWAHFRMSLLSRASTFVDSVDLIVDRVQVVVMQKGEMIGSEMEGKLQVQKKPVDIPFVVDTMSLASLTNALLTTDIMEIWCGLF